MRARRASAEKGFVCDERRGRSYVSRASVTRATAMGRWIDRSIGEITPRGRRGGYLTNHDSSIGLIRESPRALFLSFPSKGRKGEPKCFFSFCYNERSIALRDDDAIERALCVRWCLREYSQTIVDVIAKNVFKIIHRRARTQILERDVRLPAAQGHAHDAQHVVNHRVVHRVSVRREFHGEHLG